MKDKECCNGDCRQGRDCPLREKVGDHAFRFLDLLNIIRDYFWITKPFVVVGLLLLIVYAAFHV